MLACLNRNDITSITSGRLFGHIFENRRDRRYRISDTLPTLLREKPIPVTARLSILTQSGLDRSSTNR